MIADANWRIELNVACEKCGHYFDILDDFKEQEKYRFCEIGESKELKDFSVTCPLCKTEIEIKEVIY